MSNEDVRGGAQLSDEDAELLTLDPGFEETTPFVDEVSFVIEASLRFEHERAKEEGDAYEEVWVTPTRSALEQWRPAEGQSTRATLRFNLASRLCAFGWAQNRPGYVKEGIDLYAAAATDAAAAGSDDRHLRAKSLHNYALALLTWARALGVAEDFQAVAEAAQAAAKEWERTKSAGLCGYAHFMHGSALLELTRRTGELDLLKVAATAFAESAKHSRVAGDVSSAGKADHNRGFALFEMAKRTGDVARFRAAADAFDEAAHRCTDDPAGAAQACHERAVVLLSLARLTGQAEDFESSAAAFAESAGHYRSAGDLRAVGIAHHNRGYVFADFLKLHAEERFFEAAVSALEESEKAYAELGTHRAERSNALRFQGMILLRWGRATENVERLSAASEKFAEASVEPREWGDPQTAAFCLNWQARALADCAKRTGDLKYERAQVDVFRQVIADLGVSGRAEDRARFERHLGSVLRDLGRKTEDAATFRSAAQAFGEAATTRAGTKGGLVTGLDRKLQGECLSEYARLSGDATGYREAAAVFSALAEFEDGERNVFGFAEAKHQQGVALANYAERSGDIGTMKEAGAAFAAAAEGHRQTGRERERARALHNRGATLLRWANHTKAAGDFRASAESSSSAAEIYATLSDEEGRGGRSGTLHNLGGALLELARDSQAPADFQVAADVCAEAIELLRAVGDAENLAESEERHASALDALRRLAPATEVDKRGDSVAPRKDTNREGVITEDEPSETAPRALREEFAAKVAAARLAVDEVARDLEERIRGTVGAPLESREAEEELIAAVDDALELGIVITVDGREATKLFFQDEILTWRLARGGGRGFRKHAAHTTVSGPAGIPSQAPHPSM